MKKALILFSTFQLLVFSLCANVLDREQKQASTAFNSGEIAKKESLKSGCAYPGRIKVNNEWGIFITGSFLYWQLLSEQFDYAWVTDPISNTTTKVSWDYKYKPAFKLGIGYNLPHDDWQLFFEYIRYDARNDISSDAQGLFFAYWSSQSGGTPLSTRGKQHLNSNFINATLGRPFYLGYNVVCNTFIGLRAWWLKHTANIKDTFLDDNDQIFIGKFSSKADAWAVGSRFGIDTKYLLGAGCRVFGKAVGNLLYRNNKTKSSVPTDNSNSIYIEKNNFLSPELELGIGFGWGAYFDNLNWYFDLAASYDFNIFWNHEATPNIIQNFYSDLPSPHLYLHGLTLTATFDF